MVVRERQRGQKDRDVYCREGESEEGELVRREIERNSVI